MKQTHIFCFQTLCPPLGPPQVESTFLKKTGNNRRVAHADRLRQRFLQGPLPDTQTHQEEAASSSNFPVPALSVCMSHSQQAFRVMNPCRQVPWSARTQEHGASCWVRPPIPLQTPDGNQHVPVNHAFDVFYAPVVYVNMNKGTLSLFCSSQWGQSVYSWGVIFSRVTSSL